MAALCSLDDVFSVTFTMPFLHRGNKCYCIVMPTAPLQLMCVIVLVSKTGNLLVPKKSILRSGLFCFWAILELSSGRLRAKAEVLPIGTQDDPIGLT